MHTHRDTRSHTHGDTRCTVIPSISPQRAPEALEGPAGLLPSRPFSHMDARPKIRVLGFDPDLLRANALLSEEAHVVDTYLSQPPAAYV